MDAEVLGLFRDQIPDQALGQGEALETSRQRQGCIPDLRLGLQVQLDPRPVDYHPRPGRRPAVPQAGQPDPIPPPPPPPPPRRAPTGEVTRYLAELKVISAGPTRYPRGLASSRDKAANRRARALPAEYRHKLSVIDTAYSCTMPGKVGPFVARLESLGPIMELVVGAFGEVSADLGSLVKAMAESRVLFLAREMGKPVTEGWTSVVCLASTEDTFLFSL